MAPKVFANAGANVKARVKKFAYEMKSGKPDAPKAKAPSALEKSGVAPDGNAAKIKETYPDVGDNAMAKIQEAPKKTPEAGAEIYEVEKPLVQELAADPEAKQNAAKFSEETTGADPEQAQAKLKESNTKAGMETKMKVVQIFVIVSLAAGGLAYFIISAKKRQECVDAVFRQYPYFKNRALLKQKMAKLGDKCDGAEQSQLCADINDAYTRLEECDNTLFRNIVGELLDIGGDVADKGLDVMGKIAEAFGDMFSKIWPIVVAVVVVLLLAAGGYMLWKWRAARAPRADKPSFGSFGRRYSRLHRTPR
jgi:flagellar basal body-associated protein FliL